MSDLTGLLERVVPALNRAGLGIAVQMASAEDTIIAKLEWSKLAGGSERQRRDVAGIIATLGDTLDRVYLEHWLTELELQAEWTLAQRTPLS